MKFRKETRGYLPLEHLMNDLENDDDPAHPEPSVTVNSLLGSWPTMTESQAAWLMGMLDTHTQGAQEKEKEKKAKEQVKHLAEEEKTRQKDGAEEKLAAADEAMQSQTTLLQKSLEELLELKPVCIDTGMSYEERVAMREEELEALKKALCILMNYSEFGPEGAADKC